MDPNTLAWYYWLAIGFFGMWALLTLMPQPWTDWLTRQNYFGWALIVMAIVFFAVWTVPYLTPRILIGVVVTIVILVLGVAWIVLVHSKPKADK